MSADPLNDLRDGLRALLAETERLWDLAHANGWRHIQTCLAAAKADLQDALTAANTEGLRAGIADTHAGQAPSQPEPEQFSPRERALMDALLALVDNAESYDQSIVGAAALRMAWGGEQALSDRIHVADRNGRRVLRAIQDGEL